MHETMDATFFERLDAIFATLSPSEVEQFAAAYRQWFLQQRIVEIRARITATQEQIAENERRLRQVTPSPLALASLARLQASGVSDTDTLDRLLERGETWLDETMQRLDYCEQFDNFLSEDYTGWCKLALDGAFDWIDTARGGNAVESPSYAAEAGEAEVLFQQKSDDAQDGAQSLPQRHRAGGSRKQGLMRRVVGRLLGE